MTNMKQTKAIIKQKTIRNQRPAANRVASPPANTDGENLSHHCTYGSRIQRFVKMWSNLFVVRKHGLISPFTFNKLHPAATANLAPNIPSANTRGEATQPTAEISV